MTRRRTTTWQRRLFDPDGPGSLLEGDRKTELPALLAQLIREAATDRAAGEGGGHEQDHA